MKKKAQFVIVFVLLLLEAFLIKLIFEFYETYNSRQVFVEATPAEEESLTEEEAEQAVAEVPPVYTLYEGGIYAGEFDSFAEAKGAASGEKGIEILKNETEVYDNRNPFMVFRGGKMLAEFSSYPDALWYAKKHINSKIILRKEDIEIWNFGYTPPKSRKLDADAIMQLPELARGCEVVSLAMLLNYAGINADKMRLAEQIKKNEDYFGWKGDKKYSGDPNEGFIGDIYSFDNDGLGVYHKPIYELSKLYMNSAIDLTGSGFKDLYSFLGQGYPVWVIINGEYNKLPESEFETWYKTDGTEMKITYREHSVLLTGYDEEFVYFNDPLTGKMQAPAAEFQAGWEQMGSQALSYVK